MKKLTGITIAVSAALLGATLAVAKLPPPPPLDEKGKAAAEEKKAKDAAAAEAAKKALAEAEDRAVKSYQATMKSQGKPALKPVAIAAAAAPGAAAAKPGAPAAAPAAGAPAPAAAGAAPAKPAAPAKTEPAKK